MVRDVNWDYDNDVYHRPYPSLDSSWDAGSPFASAYVDRHAHEVLAPQEVRDKELIGEMTTYDVVGTGSDVVRIGENSMSVAEENLRQALALFASQTALAGRFGGKQPPVGTVLRWVKKFDPTKPGEIVLNQNDREAVRFTIDAPTEYVYVAFRAPNEAWYITGNRSGARMESDWDRLLKEIGDSECQLVSDWTDVPVPEKPAEDALDPVAWARLMFGPKTKEAAEDDAQA